MQGVQNIYFIFDTAELFCLIYTPSTIIGNIRNTAIILCTSVICWSNLFYLIPTSCTIFDFSASSWPGSRHFPYCFVAITLASFWRYHRLYTFSVAYFYIYGRAYPASSDTILFTPPLLILLLLIIPLMIPLPMGDCGKAGRKMVLWSAQILGQVK